MGFGIGEADPPQEIGIVFGGSESAQANGVIGTQAGGFVDRAVSGSQMIEIALGSSHEESGLLNEGVKPREIDVASIQHIEGSGLQDQVIERVDVVDFPVGDVDKTGDASPQIDQGVKLHRRFVFAKSCPGK